MLSNWRGKVDIDDIHKFIIITSVIFLISALFIPFIFIFIAQDILFHSRDHWYFGTPVSAYLLTGVGMLTLPVIAIVYSLLRMVRFTTVQRSGFIGLVLFFMIASGIPFYVLGIHSYYYFDDEGVHKNEITTTELTSFEWEEIGYFIPEVSEESNISSYEAYHFIDQNEVLMTIPYKHEFSHLRRTIIQKVESNGGKALERKTSEEWNEWIETRQP